MEYRQLGTAGVRISAIGLGTNRFGTDALPQKEVNNLIDAALDLGINHIDTADVYVGGRSEETLGEALKGRWDRFFVATKFVNATGRAPTTGAPLAITSRRLSRPACAACRAITSTSITCTAGTRARQIAETLRALDDLIRAGKVRYVGASSFASWQLAHANLLAEVRGWTPFAALQSHYHMLERTVEREVLPYCRAHGVGFVPYFPLAGGFLTGKYQRGEPAPAGSRGESNRYVQGYMTAANYDRVEKLTAWAEARDRGHERTGRSLAAGPATGLLGHRGRDPAGTPASERQGRRLAADRERAGRGECGPGRVGCAP